MSDYDDFIAMAQELIGEEGRTITLAQLDRTIADPDKPWKGAGTPTPINPVTTPAVFVPVSSLTNLGINIKDTELFKEATSVLMVPPPPTGEDLTTYHVFVEGNDIAVGSRARITVTHVLKPGPVPVLYVFGAMR